MSPSAIDTWAFYPFFEHPATNLSSIQRHACFVSNREKPADALCLAYIAGKVIKSDSIHRRETVRRSALAVDDHLKLRHWESFNASRESSRAYWHLFKVFLCRG